MGWFKVDRDIQKHWIWKSKEPFDLRSAWIDLLLMANYMDFQTERKMQVVNRKRGEVNTSYRYLAERWRWDRRKVKRFLTMLEKDGMVSIYSTKDGTTITVENYSKYQDTCTTDCTTDGTTDGTTHSTTDGTNDKKYKNIKNYYSSEKKGIRPQIEGQTLEEKIASWRNN